MPEASVGSGDRPARSDQGQEKVKVSLNTEEIDRIERLIGEASKNLHVRVSRCGAGFGYEICRPSGDGPIVLIPIASAYKKADADLFSEAGAIISRLLEIVAEQEHELMRLQVDPLYDNQRNEGAILAARRIRQVIDGSDVSLSPGPLMDACTAVAIMRDKLKDAAFRLRVHGETL